MNFTFGARLNFVIYGGKKKRGWVLLFIVVRKNEGIGIEVYKDSWESFGT